MFLHTFILIAYRATSLAARLRDCPEHRALGDLPKHPWFANRELQFDSTFNTVLRRSFDQRFIRTRDVGTLFAPLRNRLFTHATTGTSWAIAHASSLGYELPLVLRHGFWYGFEDY